MPRPERGDVWLVDMGFVAKVRPALVMSPAADGDERVITTVIPHTTSVRSTRYEVASDVRWLKAGAFDAQGIGTYPTAKLVRRLGRLPDEQFAAVETAVIAWLGLSERFQRRDG